MTTSASIHGFLELLLKTLPTVFVRSHRWLSCITLAETKTGDGKKMKFVAITFLYPRKEIAPPPPPPVYKAISRILISGNV